MAASPAPSPPDALLLIAPGCPYCPHVLEALGALVKEGAIGTLEVVNIAVRPERATALGVRSVPWVRIGPFNLQGMQTVAELRSWAERAASGAGRSTYLEQELAAGHLQPLVQLLSEHPDWLPSVVPLIENPDTGMHVRLGVGALLEHFAGGAALRDLTDELGRLSSSADHRIRSDACHYLGLTGDQRAVPYLRARLDDPQAEVSEIAAESLATLGETVH